ncbi:hypothetical protein ANTPLA_LOCUS6946 [Anthophora plagiata]
MVSLCSKYPLSVHKRFALFGDVIVFASIAMKLYGINLLFCFLTFVIFVNAKSNRKETFEQDYAMEFDSVPRVKVKVFRGPSEERDGKKFTMWGFWIKQPANVKK